MKNAKQKVSKLQKQSSNSEISQFRIMEKYIFETIVHIHEHICKVAEILKHRYQCNKSNRTLQTPSKTWKPEKLFNQKKCSDMLHIYSSPNERIVNMKPHF